MSRRLRLLLAMVFLACAPAARAQSDAPSGGSQAPSGGGQGPSDGGFTGSTLTLDVATITALLVALLGVSAVGFSLAGYALRVWVRGHVDPPLTRLATLADRLSEQASPPRLTAFSPSRYLGEREATLPATLGAAWMSPSALHLLTVAEGERAAVLARLAADLLSDPDVTVLVASSAVDARALGDALAARGPAAVRASAGRLFCAPPPPDLDPMAAAWSLSGNGPLLALILDGWDLRPDDAEATPLLRLGQRSLEAAQATGAALLLALPPYPGRSLSWAGSVQAREAHAEGGALRPVVAPQPPADLPADLPTDVSPLNGDTDAVTDVQTEEASPLDANQT